MAAFAVNTDCVTMIELNESNFETEVVRKSFQMPVLVDFWADWCAPCKMLTPVLEKLADDYPDQLHICKVNTDVERGLAQQHGIRSLPTLHLYRNGEVVEQVLGAQPESTLRALVEDYMVRASDNILQEALAKVAGGDRAKALQLLEQAWEEDPQNPRLPLELAQLYIDDGQLDRASQFLESLPHEVRESDEGKGLRLLLEFAATAAGVSDAQALASRLEADPADSEARYQLAARQIVGGEYDAALENLLALLTRDRGYGDGAAQRGLLAVFSVLGEDDPRVAACRRRMFTLLH
jgi:putative thioredoxin